MKGELTFESLMSVFRGGGEDDVVRAFRGRSEAERRVVGPALIAFRQTDQAYEQLKDSKCAVVAALFASCTLAEIKKLESKHRFGLYCTEGVRQVLLDRKPSWLSAWVTHALAAEARPSGRARRCWAFIRLLVEDGLIEAPSSDEWILAMIQGLGEEAIPVPREEVLRVASEPGGWGRRRGALVLERLRNDPLVRDRDFWRWFEVPGRPSRTLSAKYPYPVSAIVEVSREGILPRERLFASIFDALRRDFSENQAGWYRVLYDALVPTAAERAQYLRDLLDLLSSRLPGTVKFSIRELDLAQEEGSLPPAGYIAEVESTLITMPMVTAVAALRLLKKVLASAPEFGSIGAAAAAMGSHHPHPDVRKLARGISELHGEMREQPSS